MGFSKEGVIKGLDVHLYCNAGCSLDLSSSIMDRALLHTDNAYRLGAVRAVGHICKTNMASNTAFRGFGGPQVWGFQHSAAHIMLGNTEVHQSGLKPALWAPWKTGAAPNPLTAFAAAQTGRT